MESNAFLQRCAIVESFAAHLKRHQHAMATAISESTGKPYWETEAEVSALIGKCAISIDAFCLVQFHFI